MNLCLLLMFVSSKMKVWFNSCYLQENEKEIQKESQYFVLLRIFFKEKDIPLTNILAGETDGAPSMLGRHLGFISFLKTAVSGVLTVHCIRLLSQ